jgi:hypothetical protein
MKYTSVCLHQNAGQNHSINIASKSFENDAKFKHLGTLVENLRCIHEEVKSTLNQGSTYMIQFRIFSPPIYLKRKEYNLQKVVACTAVADIPGSFLGNGSVNTFPQQQIDAQQWRLETGCFFVVLAEQL